MSIVKAYDLPEEFPDGVKKQLKSIPDEVDERIRQEERTSGMLSWLL